MKRKHEMKLSVKTVSIVILLLVTGIVQVSAQEKEKKYENAPRVTPKTTEAMQTAAYWIENHATDPDKVVLSPSQIEELNKATANIPETLQTMKNINGETYDINRTIRYNDITGAQYVVIDPLDMTSFPGDSLRARLRTHREHFESRDYYDHRQMKYDEFKKKEFYEKTNADAIPDTITPRYGIAVVHSNCRVLPTNEIAYGTTSQWYVRGLQSASVDVAMPMAILHESKDKDWYYVRTEVSFGWIPAEDVALAPARKIAGYVDDSSFVVALDHTVPVFGDKNFGSFLADLYLGSKVKLSRKSAGGYQVRMPYRNSDGSLAFVSGWIRSNANVSVGYQPFTQRNMYTTLFNILYRPYSWNDANHEWNCCGYIRAVLRTFGIKVGSWPSFQMHYANHCITFPKDTPREKKYSYLDKCEPGITLVGGDGHVNVFLGKENGVYYVIHMGGYDYTVEDGTVMMFRRINVNHTELPGSYNIDDWEKISPLIP